MSHRHYLIVYAKIDFGEDEVLETDKVPVVDSDRRLLDEILSRHRSNKDGFAVGIEVTS